MNCQPAESSGMTGKGANQQEQVPCPKCGKHVQRRNLKKDQRSQHDGVRRRRHACPFCKPGVRKTYSTFQDWKNHLHTTHDQCLESVVWDTTVKSPTSKFLSWGGVGSLDWDRRPWLDRPWSDELSDDRLGPCPRSSPLTDRE